MSARTRRRPGSSTAIVMSESNQNNWVRIEALDAYLAERTKKQGSTLYMMWTMVCNLPRFFLVLLFCIMSSFGFFRVA